MVSCSIHVVVGGWLLSSAVKTVPAVTTVVTSGIRLWVVACSIYYVGGRLLSSAVELLLWLNFWHLTLGGWLQYIEVAEQSPPFLASLCRHRARIVNRGNYEGWRRMPVMGSSCPLPCTLGGTVATSRDQIACWTLPSVTMVNHIVTMVHCDSGDAPCLRFGAAKDNTRHLHRSLCCHQWDTNANKR